MGRKQLVFLTVCLSFFLLLLGCAKQYLPQDYKEAILSAHKTTLGKKGISINALIFVMRYDSEPTANSVALFYSKNSRDSFSYLKTKFPTPQALRDWVLDYIRKYIRVQSE